MMCAPTGWRTTRQVLVAAAIAVVLGASACASSGRSDGESVARAPAGPAAGSGDAGTGGAPGAPTADKGESQPASLRADALAAPGQPAGQFISTARMTIEVDDVAAVKPDVVAAAERAGGALFGEESSYGRRARSVITLKVPPANFSPLLGELAKLGTLASQEVRTDDVTQQVIDLDARIAAASASLDRTRDLLGKATSLPDIARLEGEVSRRQADLESLRGQQKTLQGRISLATIVVTLDGPEDATPAERERRREPEPAALPGFLDGLRGSLEVTGKILTVGSAVLGASVPFLPLLVLLVLALRWRRRRRPVAPGSGGSAGPKAPLPPPPNPASAST
jgi:hypothetical protein